MITKQGKKYEMDPLAEPSGEKHVVNSVVLMSGKKFLKVVKKEKGVCCVVVVKPREKMKEKIQVP